MLAGSLLAFNAHTLTGLGQLQTLHAQWFPLALWALDRLLIGGRRRDGLWLALFVSLAVLTSSYMAVLIVVMLVAAGLSRPDRWWRRQGLAVAGTLVMSAALAAVLLTAMLWPYSMAFGGVPVPYPVSDVVRDSATLTDYLSTPGRWHAALWSHRFFDSGSDALFPGVAALALGIDGLSSRRVTPGHVRMFAAIGIAGLALSLGTTTPLYGWLYSVLPPLGSIESTTRFGYLLLFAIAGLAGLGLCVVRQRCPSPRWAMSVAVILIATANLKALVAPMSYARFSGFSPLYDVIARDPDARAVVEFPFHSVDHADGNGTYVLASTRHWQPLVNGHGRVISPSYQDAAKRLEGFPTEQAVRFLEDLGVTHLVVHDRAIAARLEALVRRSGGLALLGVDAQQSRLYRLDRDDGGTRRQTGTSALSMQEGP